jgi:hypothetical protein
LCLYSSKKKKIILICFLSFFAKFCFYFVLGQSSAITDIGIATIVNCRIRFFFVYVGSPITEFNHHTIQRLNGPLDNLKGKTDNQTFKVNGHRVKPYIDIPSTWHEYRTVSLKTINLALAESFTCFDLRLYCR